MSDRQAAGKPGVNGLKTMLVVDMKKSDFKMGPTRTYFSEVATAQ
jgi:hypothetical protein